MRWKDRFFDATLKELPRLNNCNCNAVCSRQCSTKTDPFLARRFMSNLIYIYTKFIPLQNNKIGIFQFEIVFKKFEEVKMSKNTKFFPILYGNF